MLQRSLRVSSCWETVIGIETHVQLKTREKLFSAGRNPLAGQSPNSVFAPFDLATPGTLPVLNRSCVKLGIRAALALDSTLRPRSSFDRKHYFYADLPTGYQITQYYSPLASGGVLKLSDQRPIRIQQIQLEQDTAKSSKTPNSVYVDYNRAGCALLEIVTEPDMRSAEEATSYVRKLQRMLRAVSVSDGNMEDGSMRCDVNVSVNRRSEARGTRCEIKNLNSVKSIKLAIAHEINRHIGLLEAGQQVAPETRGYDEDRVETFSLRGKETTPDYRFMPDANLGPLIITQAEMDDVRRTMPNTPEQEAVALSHLGLNEREIEILLSADSNKEVFFDGLPSVGAVSLFRATVSGRDPKTVFNWIINELSGQLAYRNLDFSESPLTASQLGSLIDAVQSNQLTRANANDVLRHILNTKTPAPLQDVIEELGLKAEEINLQELCTQAISSLPSIAAAVKQGKTGAINRLVGQVMRLSNGRAKASEVKSELMRRLESEVP